MTDEQRRAADHAGRHLLIVAGAGTGKTTTLAAAGWSRSSPAGGARAHPAAHVQPAGRGRAAPPGGGHRRPRGLAAVLGRHLPRHRQPAPAPPRPAPSASSPASPCSTRATPPTCSRSCAPSCTPTTAPRSPIAPPGPQGHDGGGPEPGREHRHAAHQVLKHDFPWCADDRDELRAVFAAYTARKRRHGARLRRPPAVLARAAALPVARCSTRSSTTSSSTSTRTPTRCKPTCWPDGRRGCHHHRGGRRRAGDLRLPQPRRSATSSTSRQRFGADVVLLERNHRSTPSILATANAVIAEAAERHPKVLRSPADPTAGAPRSSRAPTKARSPPPCARASSSSTSGASPARPGRAVPHPRTTATCSSSSSPPAHPLT